jgi:hypothetical protein
VSNVRHHLGVSHSPLVARHAIKDKGRLAPVHTIKAYRRRKYNSTHSQYQHYIEVTDLSCRAGLRRRSAAARLLRSGFESHRGHGCLSVVSVVCCQVEVSATS